MKAQPNPRITLESLEASETVPFVGIHKSDFQLLLGPALIIGVVGLLAGSLLAGAVGGVLALFLSGTIVYITPSYMTARQYMGTVVEHLQRPKQFTYTTDTTMDPESYFDHVEEDKTTTELTHVRRYYRRGVIERDDGQMVAAVKLEPQSMDFAQAEEWAETTEIAEEFANNSLDFDTEFHITSRQFPIETYIENLESRLEDDDVSSLPMLRATLKDLIKERPEQMEEANLAPLHFYAIVTVDKGEVVTNTTADTSALEKLSRIPVLGIPFATFATLREDRDELHKKTRMMRKLDERISAVETGLVRNIDGYDASRVNTVELVHMLEDFWKPYTPDFQSTKGVADAAPIVIGDEVSSVENAIESEVSEEDSTRDGADDAENSETAGSQQQEGTDQSDEEEDTGDSEGVETGSDDLESAVQDSDFEFEFEPADVEPPTSSSAEDGSESEENTSSTEGDESSDSFGDEEGTEDENETEDEEQGLIGLLADIFLGGEEEDISNEDDETEEDDHGSSSTSAYQFGSDDDSSSEMETEDEETQEDDSEEDEEEEDSENAGLLNSVAVFLGFGEGEDHESVTEDEPTAPDPGSIRAEEMKDIDLPEKEDIQQLRVSPEDIEKGFRSVTVEDTEYRQVLFVETMPKNINVGALRELFTRSALNIDISIHVNPKDREEALSKAERRVQSLETDASAGLGGYAAQDKLEEAEEAEIFRDYLDAGQRPFEVSFYVVVREENKKDLRDSVRTVRDIFRDAPANMGLKTLSGNQIPGLEAASPIGKDVISSRSDFTTNHLLLGQGVGSILSSFKQSTLLEEDGIEFGEHAFNKTPIIKDPFESETNYNWTVIGDSGSGKSYESKLMALRTMMSRKDTKLIILDPLEGFFGLSKALNAEHITIGGERGLNPLEIRPPAEHSTETEDVDPLKQKIKDAMSFFENFTSQQGYEIGSQGPILQAAIRNAYERKGITHDISTHGRESPTIHDVLDSLQMMADNPGEYVIRSVTEREKIREHASELINYLRPFVDGAYQNLARQSEFDLRGEDVVYLDLSQQEHTSSGGGIMMQLLFSLVYERAKETPKDVIFLIDEARFLMRDANNLEFLGQRVRHSRHYNTSIRFITQNIGDFFDHEEAESIINNSFINIFHQTEEIGQWADVFNLNDQEVTFVKNAQTGKNGYSEALVTINNTQIPMQFFATDPEHAIIDFDPRTQTKAELPGSEKELSDLAREIRTTLEDIHEATADQLQQKQPELDAIYQDLPPAHQEYLSVLNDYEFYTTLDMIHQGQDPSVVTAAAVSEKLSTLVGEIDETELQKRLQQMAQEYENRDEEREEQSETGQAAMPRTDD